MAVYTVGLCFQDVLLPKLWMLITHLGPQCGLRSFLDVLAVKSADPTSHPLFSLLRLASDTSLHIIVSVELSIIYAGGTCFRKLVPETCMRNLPQVHHGFLHQKNFSANHVAGFMSPAGQFLWRNRAVLSYVQETCTWWPVPVSGTGFLSVCRWHYSKVIHKENHILTLPIGIQHFLEVKQ